MNWDAIGAIAELLGAIGVIASLVYLATQIRQSREQMVENTRALRAGTYQDFQRNVDEVFNRLIVDPENRRPYENALYQRRVGLLDEERWRVQLLALSSALLNPGVGQWWNAAGYRSYSPEFVALVEEILGEERQGGDPTR
jgi:hypothetical protein